MMVLIAVALMAATCSGRSPSRCEGGRASMAALRVWVRAQLRLDSPAPPGELRFGCRRPRCAAAAAAWLPCTGAWWFRLGQCMHTGAPVVHKQQLVPLVELHNSWGARATLTVQPDSDFGSRWSVCGYRTIEAYVVKQILTFDAQTTCSHCTSLAEPLLAGSPKRLLGGASGARGGVSAGHAGRADGPASHLARIGAPLIRPTAPAVLVAGLGAPARQLAAQASPRGRPAPYRPIDADRGACGAWARWSPRALGRASGGASPTASQAAPRCRMGGGTADGGSRRG